MVASAIQPTSTPANIIANPAAAKSSLMPRSIFDMNQQQVDRLMMLADVISQSQLSYSKMGSTKLSKGDVALVMLKGLSIGFTEMAALDLIDLIVGKPALKPQGMLALIYDSGELQSITFDDDGTTAIVTAKRRGMPEHTERFSMDDAARMKTTEYINNQKQTIPLAEKSNWKAQPAVMRKWRAISAMARVLFPDIIQGMYTPEELDPNLIVDEDGNVIGGTITMDAPKKAGETYLATVDGKNRLANLLLELGINKQADYARIFTTLGITAFGESTLNEPDLHSAIRKAAASIKPATEPAAPAIEAESVASETPATSETPETAGTTETGWANPKTIGLLVTLLSQRTVENLSASEMARLAGISPADDYDAWNAKYSSGKVAGDAIVGQFMSELKPAQPKSQTQPAATAFEWNDDTRKQAEQFLYDRFGLTMAVALDMVGKKLEAFTSLNDFANAVWTAAFAKGTPFMVTRVEYHPGDTAKKTQGYTTFPDVSIPSPRMYGSTDHFKKLDTMLETPRFGTPEFQKLLKAGGIITLPMSVKVQHKPGKTFQEVTGLEIDIPF